MKRTGCQLASLIFLIGIQATTFGQTPNAQHVAAVAKAQSSGYARRDATNNCPAPANEILGWPAALLRECVYVEGPNGHQLTAYVVLLDLKPETIATWIETACSQILPTKVKCFQRVLTCGQITSGMMVPVSGNMMENMNNGLWKNWFFRNGMTVRMSNQANGTTEQIPLDRQKQLAQMSDTAIIKIPTGITRLWRTTPAQFAARFPAEDTPHTLTTQQDRQKWLDITRAEFISPITKPNNRLLEAWLAAHKVALASGGACPKDSDP
jgi:hypothetical protein